MCTYMHIYSCVYCLDIPSTHSAKVLSAVIIKFLNIHSTLQSKVMIADFIVRTLISRTLHLYQQIIIYEAIYGFPFKVHVKAIDKFKFSSYSLSKFD